MASDRAVLLTHLLEVPPSTERIVEHWRAARGPALPALMELGTAPNGFWAVCEGADGESLRWLMSSLAKASSFIKPNEGLAVVARVALALEGLHRQGLIHGDVSPSTVFLTARGEVHVHGAGLAAFLPTRDGDGPWRSEPGFLAPEQIGHPATTRSDVFRLGLMLYELAVGRPLWSGPTPAHLAYAAANFRGLPREKVRQVPEPWQSLILSLLTAEPGERPSMQEVSLALEEGLRQSGWGAGDDELVRLFERAAAQRTSCFAPEAGPPVLLELVPLGGPAVTPPTSSSSVVARITTKKMTREMLAVARTTPAEPIPARPLLAPVAELAPRLVDALLASQGQRGVQAQQVISLAGALGKRFGLSPAEVQQAASAARTMVASALAMGRLSHDVPTLAEVHDKLGCITDADAAIEALHAFPGRLPATPSLRAVVLAFAFAAHAGEARPSSSRLGGALTSFQTKFPMPASVFETLVAELARG
ncbi:MAG TPA: protein kinase [Archangium sp.]